MAKTLYYNSKLSAEALKLCKQYWDTEEGSNILALLPISQIHDTLMSYYQDVVHKLQQGEL